MAHQVIGNYRILGELGQGGMGIVYRARHTQSEQAVALKTVKPGLAFSARWLDGLRREIHALTRIRHPGIVRIVDHGVHLGLPWYAMDLLEGERLDDFCKRMWSPYRWAYGASNEGDDLPRTSGVYAETAEGTVVEVRPPSVPPRSSDGVPPAAAGQLTAVLRLMRRVCATLAYLHGEGLINCDIAPRNIVLVAGEPVLIDFGLSSRYPGGSSRESVEPLQFAGTLPYMSPEQLRGEFVDARSDLYAAGCLLYELVVGRPPYVGPHRVSFELQHQGGPPLAPSQLVYGVGPELDALLLKLLEQNPFDRFGHADEVATALAHLSGDVQRLPDFPPSRAYLYRPRFVGREETIERLDAHRNQLLRGRGALVLLGGESGIGKSRVAMELTRGLASSSLRIVTTEASPLAAQGAGALTATPLHALRPLLEAVADRCQEGGAEVTERLLGDRRAVLAPYEPLLAQVPERDALQPAIPLRPQAARERLFRYLSEVVALLAVEQPLLWIWDDLGWADSLSLAFLQWLPAAFFEHNPVLLLATHRTEEHSDAIAALIERGAVSIRLERLPTTAVKMMIEDMLALRDMPRDFLDFVVANAGGNPFFVAEYLRAAVNERILYRGQRNVWQLQPAHASSELLRNLGLPNSVRELIEKRLRQLTPAAAHAVAAAAVLGREVRDDQIRLVAGLSIEAGLSATEELLRAHVLEDISSGLRFAHDQLREVAYAELSVERRRHLHEQAAKCLENEATNSPVAHEYWAGLAHHFERAGRLDAAVKFAALAAGHARATHANDQAISLYRKAIELTTQLSLGLEESSTHLALIEHYEALADVLALTSQREDARAAYDAALRASRDLDCTLRARLLRKLGKTWEAEHKHAEALACYADGRNQLAEPGPNASPAMRQEWMQLHVEELWVYYWLNRVDEMERTVETIAPLLHASAPHQQSKVYHAMAMKNLRRDRYRVSMETLSLSKRTLDLCQVEATALELPMVQFFYGFCLLLYSSLSESEAQLQAALELAERAGEIGHQARCLAYLGVAARRRGDVTATSERATRCLATATRAGLKEYAAAALANHSWVELRQGQLAACEANANDAWQGLKTFGGVFPFYWLALVPLLDVRMRRGDIEGAMPCVDALLAPEQHACCEPALDELRVAQQHWAKKDAAGAAIALSSALSFFQAASLV